MDNTDNEKNLSYGHTTLKEQLYYNHSVQVATIKMFLIDVVLTVPLKYLVHKCAPQPLTDDRVTQLIMPWQLSVIVCLHIEISILKNHTYIK